MSRSIRSEMEYAMQDARAMAKATGKPHAISYGVVDIGDGDDNPLAWDVFPLPVGADPNSYQFVAR